MYLKNVLKQFAISSIRFRLTFFYTLAVFILLGFLAIFLYWITINLLYKTNYEFLSDEVEKLQYILEEKSPNPIALNQVVINAPLDTNHSMYRYFIRVVDEKDRTLIMTPNADQALPAEKFTAGNLATTKSRFFWYEKNEQHYLLIESPIQLGKHKKYGLVQVTLDISYQHSVIHDKEKLGFALLIATLIALTLGFLISQRGMRSLYVLTDTVQKITDISLNQRINPTSWPKELRGVSVAFNQMLDRIETSFNKLKQFSSDLSHELRTPITNMIGQNEVALSYDYSVVEYQKVLESNLEELQRMSSLTENILFLARTESAQMHLKKILLDARQEILLVCEYYQAIADDKNIQVTCIGEGKLHANADMFRRLISNILSNSLKYSDANSKISIHIEIINNNLKITIRDNGMGIASENVPRLFERFYRVDSARSSMQSGVGLGLPIVKSIIDVHNGNIIINSELDHGTTVIITLPT